MTGEKNVAMDNLGRKMRLSKKEKTMHDGWDLGCRKDAPPPQGDDCTEIIFQVRIVKLLLTADQCMQWPPEVGLFVEFMHQLS
jgi:hypothetical protein